MPTEKRTLIELFFGIIIHVIIFLIPGAILISPGWLYVLSIITGGLAACVVLINMYESLNVALELGKEKAKSIIIKKSIFRMILMLIVMLAGLMIHWSSFVGVVIGLLGLKTSAYFNPLFKKILNRVKCRS